MTPATALLVKLLMLAHVFGGIAVWHGGDDPAYTFMTTQDCVWSYSVPTTTGYDLCTTRG